MLMLIARHPQPPPPTTTQRKKMLLIVLWSRAKGAGIFGVGWKLFYFRLVTQAREVIGMGKYVYAYYVQSTYVSEDL